MGRIYSGGRVSNVIDSRRVLAIAVAVTMVVGGFIGLFATVGHPAPAGFAAPTLGASPGVAPLPGLAASAKGHFPSAGNDTFEVSAVVGVQFRGGPPLPPVVLTGLMTVGRGQPTPGSNGLLEIPTQIIEWRTAGTSPKGPVSLTLNPLMASNGQIVQISSGGDFPAMSFFDVFFDVTLGGEVLHNALPYDVSAQVSSIPPAPGTTFQGPGAGPLPLYDPSGAPVANLTTGYLTVGLVPCFYYTEFGLALGKPYCNPKANDLRIDFNQTSSVPCQVQFTLNGQNISAPVQCPARANDLEVFWANPPAAAFITKCVWTYNGKPLSGFPCLPPAPAPANDFRFSAGHVINNYWTHNGRLMKPVLPAPNGTNDVEFYRYSSGYPAAGNETFAATGVVQLATLSGALLPAVQVSGPTTVQLGTPVLLANGTTEIPTELLAMDLTGVSPFGPVDVTINAQIGRASCRERVSECV